MIQIFTSSHFAGLSALHSHECFERHCKFKMGISRNLNPSVTGGLETSSYGYTHIKPQFSKTQKWILLIQRTTHFPTIYESSQNSRCNLGGVKQVPHKAQQICSVTVQNFAAWDLCTPGVIALNSYNHNRNLNLQASDCIGCKSKPTVL